MQFKLRQSSKETKREVTFKKPSYKNKKETPNFFNKCKYGILWKLSPDTLKWQNIKLEETMKWGKDRIRKFLSAAI